MTSQFTIPYSNSPTISRNIQNSNNVTSKPKKNGINNYTRNNVKNYTSNSNNARANKSTIPWLRNSNYNRAFSENLTPTNLALQNQLLPLRQIIFRQFLINSALQLPQQSQRTALLNRIPDIMKQIQNPQSVSSGGSERYGGGYRGRASGGERERERERSRSPVRRTRR